MGSMINSLYFNHVVQNFMIFLLEVLRYRIPRTIVQFDLVELFLEV